MQDNALLTIKIPRWVLDDLMGEQEQRQQAKDWCASAILARAKELFYVDYP